jgi:hypothetical protein
MEFSSCSPTLCGSFHRRIWYEGGNPFSWDGELSDVDKSLCHCKNNVQSVGSFIMQKVMITMYDVAEPLRTPADMAACLDACLKEADDDTAFVTKALGDIDRAKGMAQLSELLANHVSD